MGIFSRSRGSVSVFLVIILVPVIVVCSVFVDASRIKLAKSLADSAADLTLSSALSYYDLELNDYYGLLASSQSKDEFFANSQTYFKACMVSQGISTTDADKWAESLRQIIEGDSDIVDLLQIEIAGNYSLDAIEGANLANATIIKSDIIDFMKYRAPIELLADSSGFIQKLQQIGEVEKIIPVETALQDEKQEYYEAECKLLKRCGDIYIDFNAYDAMGVTEERLNTIKAYLDSLEAEYEELHKLTVMNLYNGAGRGKFYSVESRMQTPTVNTGDKVFSAQELRSMISVCRSRIASYDSAKQLLQDKLNTIPFKTWQDSYYDVQYWIQMEDAISTEYELYINCLNDMLKAWAELDNAYAHRDRLEEDEWDYVDVEYSDIPQLVVVRAAYDVKDEYSEEAYASIELSYENIRQDEIAGRRNQLATLEIWSISKKMEEISKAAVDSGRMDETEVTRRLAEVASQLQAYRTELKEADGILEDIYDNLGKLHNDVVKYDEEYADWKGLAEASAVYKEDSTIVETDLYEIETMEQGTGEKDMQRVKIDEADVELCRNRVNNVRSLFGTYIDSIDSFLYGGTAIQNIAEYKTLKNKSGIQKESIVVDKETLENYAKASFEAVFTKPGDDNYHNITDNNNPDFTIDKPDFYEWLHEQFDGKNLTDKNKADNVLKKLQEKMDEEKKKNEAEDDNSDISQNEIAGAKTDLPSQGSSGNALGNEGKEDINGVRDTTSLFGGLNLANVLTSGRDNLYVTSYIMSMFSYDTYVKENKYLLARGDDPPEDIYKTADGVTLSGLSYKDVYAKQKDAWENEDTTFTANKTLTNKMRNAVNNYTFGNEVEYIIYGGKNASNKTASYGTIFGIRYAMNIGPVFGLYWNDTQIVIPIATTISASTSGIIPVSLVKLVICLGMTAAETAVDISYLKAGLPVQFAKGQKDLFLQMNFEELAEGATELVGGFASNDKVKHSEFALSYSDYITLFLFMAVCANEETVYLRTADVIQCNMQQRDSAFRMVNAAAYYELHADLRVKPLLLATPWSVSFGSNALEGSGWNMFEIRQMKGY